MTVIFNQFFHVRTNHFESFAPPEPPEISKNFLKIPDKPKKNSKIPNYIP